MKVAVIYTTNADAEFPCCAKTEYQGREYFGIGKTWEHAKENLLKKVNALLGGPVPPAETIEVKVHGEEMDTELLPWEDGPARVIEAGKV
jgi:hypothetical protein